MSSNERPGVPLNAHAKQSTLATISDAFDKNIYFLTHYVPPNDEFKTHYRKGMFEKRSNTKGFILVSHYLLTIYDVERFKEMVQWPIDCKKTEAKYRNDVKDFITLVSNEHPEHRIPPVLSSSLLHACGIKFTTIMWKLSQVVLFVYIKKEKRADILSMPHSGTSKEAAKAFLISATRKAEADIIRKQKKLSKMKKEARIMAKEMVADISDLQGELFEKKRSLAELAAKAPVNQYAKERLADIEDTEIIQLWKNNISENISQLHEKQKVLKETETLSCEVVELASSILSDSRILDVSKLPAIDRQVDFQSILPPEDQVVLSHLYMEDKLVLRNLSATFKAALHRLWRHFKIYKFQDLSEFESEILMTCANMGILSNVFHVLLSKAMNFASDIRNNLPHKKSNFAVELCEAVNGVIDKVLFMPSPSIRILTNQDSEVPENQHRLTLTPQEGAYKALFSRHKRNEGTTPQSSKLRANLLTARINLDDTLSSLFSERQTPRKMLASNTSKMNSSMSSTQTGKYSRLFSSRQNKSNMKANFSMMSIPSSPEANSTALTNTMEVNSSSKGNSLTSTAESIVNLSKDIVNVVSVMNNAAWRSPWPPQTPSTPIEEEKEPEWTSPVSTVNNLELNDSRELELVVNDNINLQAIENDLPKSPEKTKRRSISDLTERYYNLLANRSNIVPHLETSETSESGQQ